MNTTLRIISPKKAKPLGRFRNISEFPKSHKGHFFQIDFQSANNDIVTSYQKSRKM